MFSTITAIVTGLTTAQMIGGAAVLGLVVISTPVKKIDMSPPTSTTRPVHFSKDHYRVFGADQG